MPKPIHLATPTSDAIDGLLSDTPARRVRRASQQNPASRRKKATTAAKRRQVADGHRRTTLDLPADLHERLRRAAFETDRSIKSILVEAAGPWLKEAGY